MGTIVKCALCDTVIAGEEGVLHKQGWRKREAHNDYICPECIHLTGEPTVPNHIIEPLVPESQPVMPTGMPYP